MNGYRPSLLVFFLVMVTSVVYGQFYPVQVTPQIIPPYSVYLTDYASPGNEKLRVIMVQKDLTQPSYAVRLVMSVEWNGKIIMRTSRAFNPAPIYLDPGVPTIISGADLAPYLDSRNIDFVGYSRDQYERTKSLPEGSYQIIFTAYDYRRQDVQVSNAGRGFYYLSKAEPPLINFPACGTTIPMRTPQQIIFSWLPRNTASPNSASRTLYEFSLYETRPAGRNPNDVVLSTQPVFKTTTELTQLIYGPAEPLLLENVNYVWRVRATDENGRDAFRNNGYSEVCTFTYGGVDATFNVGVVENLQAVGETEHRGKITWTKGPYDAYKVFYKKTGASHQWFSTEVTESMLAEKASSEGELVLYDLEPDTEYETRVQVKKNGVLGPYSELVRFRTTPMRIAQCGEETPMPQEGGNPLRNLFTGTVINVDGMEMTVLDASSPSNDGWYSGYATINPLVLGGAAYTVKFDRLYIREDHTAGYGRIDILSKGVAAMVQEQLTAQKERREERQQQENQDIWEGVEFYDKTFSFAGIALDTVYTDPYGNIAVIDEIGQQHIIPDIPAILKDAPEKAVIIEDKNGDQWVVEKNGDGYKTTKVEGGGLHPEANAITQPNKNEIKEQILRLILADFRVGIGAWLRDHGKGPLDNKTLALIMSLPKCFPKEADVLESIYENTIPYFEENTQELREKVEANPEANQIFNKLTDLFTTANSVTREKIPEKDQELSRAKLCALILEDERRNALLFVNPVSWTELAGGCETCPTGWEDLIGFKPTKSTWDEILRRKKHAIVNGPYNRWDILDIEKAKGSKLNLDYYSIKIEKLPVYRGKQMTDVEFFEHIRKNLNIFLDNSIAVFEHYSDRDKVKWESLTPLNAVMTFHITGELMGYQ